MALTLADRLLHGEGARLSPAVSAALRSAVRRTLTPADLARVDTAGAAMDGRDLHAWLPSVLPLVGPVWYETTVTAQRGTVTDLGYLAVPAGDEAVDVWWVSDAPALGVQLGPIGPIRVTARDLAWPEGLLDWQIRECRAAAGLTLRYLLLWPPSQQET